MKAQDPKKMTATGCMFLLCVAAVILKTASLPFSFTTDFPWKLVLLPLAAYIILLPIRAILLIRNALNKGKKTP